jgi:hypothetical protein
MHRHRYAHNRRDTPRRQRSRKGFSRPAKSGDALDSHLRVKQRLRAGSMARRMRLQKAYSTSTTSIHALLMQTGMVRVTAKHRSEMGCGGRTPRRGRFSVLAGKQPTRFRLPARPTRSQLIRSNSAKSRTRRCRAHKRSTAEGSMGVPGSPRIASWASRHRPPHDLAAIVPDGGSRWYFEQGPAIGWGACNELEQVPGIVTRGPMITWRGLWRS